MAKNNPRDTRTSRIAYCPQSLLPSSANWTTRFPSTSHSSTEGCAAHPFCTMLSTYSAPDAAQANTDAPQLCVHPFDPLSAPCGSYEWIRKVLRLPGNLSPLNSMILTLQVGLSSYVRTTSVIQRSPLPMIRRTANRFLLGWLARWLCMLRRPRVLSPDCGYSSTASS